MTRQIIHCCTDAYDRKIGIYGTTWIITQDPTHSKYVSVQFSVCSPEDQFSRKRGLYVAGERPKIRVHKAELIVYAQAVSLSSKTYALPTIHDIYKAIVYL